MSPHDHGLTAISHYDQQLFTATTVPLPVLVELAYGFDEINILHIPFWASSELLDVRAKLDDRFPPSEMAIKHAIKELLVERFQLQTHEEHKQIKGYALVLANSGLKCNKTELQAQPIQVFRNQLESKSISMRSLAGALAVYMHTPVSDETAQTANCSISLHFAPTDAADDSEPSIYKALQETLGLRLVKKRVSANYLVIDAISHPVLEN